MSEPGINEAVSEQPEPSLEKQLADLTAIMTEVRQAHTKLEDERKEIAHAIKEDREETAAINYKLQQEIYANQQACADRTAKMSTEEMELRNQAYELSRKLREAERTADSLQRQLDQQRRAELAAAEWATLEKRWDLLTMGAPWREWAKDHQIEGGKKITYEGRMILGDTMGLGKTLTSLIAIDMIEAATKNASFDNPIKFGSMD